MPREGSDLKETFASLDDRVFSAGRQETGDGVTPSFRAAAGGGGGL